MWITCFFYGKEKSNPFKNNTRTGQKYFYDLIKTQSVVNFIKT